MKRLFVLALLTIPGWATAAPITIDFEQFESGRTQLASPAIINGYSFINSDPNLGAMLVNRSDINGDLLWCPWCQLTFQQESGAAFDLFSMDLAIGDYNVATTITGFLAGGGTLERSVAIGLDYENLVFDSSWTNLLSVTIATDGEPTLGHKIDNIVVSAVPVPAAAWLFGSALAGLSWLRRKQTT